MLVYRLCSPFRKQDWLIFECRDCNNNNLLNLDHTSLSLDREKDKSSRGDGIRHSFKYTAMVQPLLIERDASSSDKNFT